MARTRRRRRRSKGGVNAATLAVGLLVVVGLWLVGGNLIKSLPPGVARDLPDLHAPSITTSPRGGDDHGGSGGGGSGGADDKASNVRGIQRLGGKVDYGKVDPKTGQRSGITATITPGMVRAASDHKVGSEPDESIRPPGFEQLPSRNRSRGHLLGRQLGGSGEVASNLVALYQSRANSPVMRDYETMVADAVKDGETVSYQVRPLYDSASDRGAPRAVRIRAVGDHGFRLDVEIANTPSAATKVAVAPAAQG
jgi:DNA-entry nuclease